MADEITLAAKLELSTTDHQHTLFSPQGLKITQNNPGVFEATASLTTSDSTLSIIGLTTYGYGFFQNISESTAVVIKIGADSTAVIRPFARLKWKEYGIIRLNPGTTYRAQCESSSGKLLYGCWED